jgi:aminopeptidase N
MKKSLALVSCLVIIFFASAQPGKPAKDTSWKTLYRATAEKVFNLIHTKLVVTPNYDKKQLVGEAWITVTPHFYPQRYLELDAKAMDITSVSLVTPDKNSPMAKKTPLNHTYNSLKLKIDLGKTVVAGDKVIVYIKYTANPEKVAPPEPGSLLSEKGIYFINADGKRPNYPTQIWTQGETEQASSWFPTIDATNQKSTQELTVTVPNKYVTLSNGLLISQKNNANGTRTDYWKMDLPHAPYLFFLGVGDYAVTKEKYKGKEVSYYVEKEYGPYAKQIFGNTPEMMGFFSKILGVEYPWAKYGQMTGREFVAGAMENTTATLHADGAQQNARELADGNKWESTIAHELFHQWFGDYVTCESWSNLTVNESFADYSEYLWFEHKFGQDKADEAHYQAMQGYMFGGASKDLVRFNYLHRETMFDEVSYQKGGRILNMLRHYLGDKAFFGGLNKYLTTNKFSTGEAHQLRLAFEEVSGKDLNWFFNQWYFGSGHPIVEISTGYNAETKKAHAIIKQTGNKIFTMPMYVDVYANGSKNRNMIWMKTKADTFYFESNTTPDLINVDGDRMMLWKRKDIRTEQEWVNTYKMAGRYADRYEALIQMGLNKTNELYKPVLLAAINDKFEGLRQQAIGLIADKDVTKGSELEKILLQVVKTDKSKPVVAAAIDKLSKTANTDYEAIYTKGVTDISYSVAGASLAALYTINKPAAKAFIPQLNKDNKGRLKRELKKLMYADATDADFETLYSAFNENGLESKATGIGDFSKFIGKLKDEKNIRKGVEALVAFKTEVASFGEGASNWAQGFINTAIKSHIDIVSPDLKKYLESVKAEVKADEDEE